MSYSDVARTYQQHLHPGFIELLETLGYARLLVRSEGVWTWDDQNRKYLDLVSGFGSMNLGHHPPALHETLKTALAEQPYCFLHTGPSAAAAELTRALIAQAPKDLDHALYSCSGAEAVEGALKVAVLATRRSTFIYCEDAFHGTSLGTLGLMGRDRMRKPFEGLLPRHVRVEFGSLESLEKALKTSKCAAFVVEPILAEGGVRVPAPTYLDEARELCHRHGALLIVDEIQTGLGRVGAFLASQSMRQSPDIVTLGKALSGGLLPISATLMTGAVHERAFKKKSDFDLHNSTFAGSALACRIAQKTLETLVEEKLYEKTESAGKRLLEQLKARLQSHPLVKDIRGQGLLIGIEIGPTDQTLLGKLAPGVVSAASQAAIGQWFALKLLEKGVLIQTASHRWDVLKVEPPLTIEDAELDLACKAIVEVFEAYRTLPKIAWELTRRVAEQSMDSERHL